MHYIKYNKNKLSNTLRYAQWIAVCSLFLIFSSLNASAQEGSSQQTFIVFISHPDNKTLTVSDVKRFFSLRKKLMDNGDSVTLAMLSPDAQESVDAFRFLLGMYPYQIQRIWDRAVFSGKGTAPTVMSNSSTIIDYVKSNTGAVAYVSVSGEAELSSLKENVNVVAIVQ